MRAGAEVVLELPLLLRDVAGTTVFRLKAATVREALDAACAEVPALRHHLLGEDGGLRAHVLLLLNDETVGSLRARLKDGDRIRILQAISGG